MTEQSPSWDDRANIELVDGEIFPGCPFNEGFPSDPMRVCELILLHGSRTTAHYEGDKWITTGSGRIIYPRVVAAWRVIDTPLKAG